MTATSDNGACAWQPSQKSTPTFDLKFSTGELPVEPNRYSLVWGKFCPWATPVAILIDLLGLGEVIAKSPVYALRHDGVNDDWFFGPSADDIDPILKTKSLGENYRLADAQFSARASVPALVDRQTGKVVNGESGTLLPELATEWRAYFSQHAPDVFPEAQRSAILAMNQQIIDNLSKPVNAINDIKSQAEYEQLSNQFFGQLAEFDQRLATQSFLFGEQVTLSDLLLFVRLVRFDLVYYFQNKLNQKRLIEFPNLWRYAKTCYQIPAFKQNTDFLAIKQHFFQVNETVSDFEHVLPIGPNTDKWEEPID